MRTLLISVFGAAALMLSVAGCNCPCKVECPDAKDDSCVAMQAETGCMNECSKAKAAECCNAQCPNGKCANGKCCKAADK